MIEKKINFDVNFIKSQFPIFKNKVWEKPLTYLDSAASMQKPNIVLQAISKSYTNEYSNVHRGLHYLSEIATEKYETSRSKVAKFLNANEKEIIFTSGATAGINLVAYSWGIKNIKKDDEIIITIAEHHANFVPWQYVTKIKDAKLKIVYFDPNKNFDIMEIEKLITDKTKLIAFPHVSNVLGTIFPVKQICSLAKRVGAVTLVDGCQGAIHFKVDVNDLGCDFYCFSGHKLYGPTGIGILYGNYNLLDEMPPFLFGGDMIDQVKVEKTTFAEPPLKFEAGTPPFVEATALGTAIDWIESIGLKEIEIHEKKVLNYGLEVLKSIKGVNIFGKSKNKAGVISFTMDCAHSHDISTIVDREGVSVRAGHHCAQPLLDAFDIVSTTRASIGAYSKFEDFDILADSLVKVKKIFGVK